MKLKKKKENKPYRIIGLTGGVASGKSTAAEVFRKSGIPVIDADLISRELSAPGGKAFEAIQKRFGTADRGKLREIVFKDSKARKELEAILHPLIRDESFKMIEELAADTGKTLFIYEAALLVETGRYKDLDGLIVVEAPYAIRKKRLIQRNSLSEDLANQILAAQISDDQRKQAATYVIENSGTQEELENKVLALLSILQGVGN